MNNLKEILNEKGIKQDWVARKLGVTKQTVSLWVLGKNEPGGRNLYNLAKLLDVEIEEIFFNKEIIISTNNNKTKIKEPEKSK